MKNLSIYPLFLLLMTISCISLVMTSCGGDDGMEMVDPMDPMDPDPMDPEECVNPDTERFFADYLGTFQCRNETLIGVLDSDSLFFTIKEPVSDEDCNIVFLSLIIDGLPLDLEATVDGNILTVNDSFDNFAIPQFPSPIDSTMLISLIANVTGEGVAELTNNDTRLEGDLILDIVEVSGALSIRDTCTLIGNKI